MHFEMDFPINGIAFSCTVLTLCDGVVKLLRVEASILQAMFEKRQTCRSIVSQTIPLLTP